MAISRRLCQEKIKKNAKNTREGVYGDIPISLSKEIGIELAIPASKTFNKIVQTCEWPSRWKKESGLNTLNLDRLSIRRASFCLKFAQEALKSEKHSSWFVPDLNVNNTRRKLNKTMFLVSLRPP